MSAIRSVRRRLQSLDVPPAAYEILGTIHLVLVIGAGLITMTFLGLAWFSGQLELVRISLFLFVGYVVCDLVRLRFPRGVIISLGFPIIVLALLINHPDNFPLATLLIAVPGSLISEAVRSGIFAKRRLRRPAVFRRASLYAGHHAIAGLGALIAYQLICDHFVPWLGLDTIHAQAALAYIVTYSLISMLLIRPHDLRIRLFLILDQEPLVRVDSLLTLSLVPLPAFVFYLYNLNVGQTLKVLGVVGVLPLIFVMLFFLGRSFTEIAEEQERLALRAGMKERLGSPSNTVEMGRQILKAMEPLVDYRWGAAYSGRQLEQCGVKLPGEPLILRDPPEDEETGMAGEKSNKNQSEVAWPSQVKSDEGILSKLAREPLPPQFFHRGLEPETPSEPHLPPQTALIVFPITAEAQEGGEASQRLIGRIALARPGKRFTTRDWERGRALSSEAVNPLRTVQRADETVQRLLKRVEGFAENPERVRLAMQELVVREVRLHRFLQAVSQRLLNRDLWTVLQSAAGGREEGISLTPEMLTEVYNQVRHETAEPVMPSLDEDEHILELLQTVVAPLSAGFGLGYLASDAESAPVSREFYKFLLNALGANTTARIAALESQITSTIAAVKESVEALEVARKLRDVVRLVKEYSVQEETAAQNVSLDRALNVLTKHERNAQRKLKDPERLLFLKIVPVWRAAITNTLEDLRRGPARMRVSLRGQQAAALKEIAVGLALQNEGPGTASRVVVQLERAPDYEVLEGKVSIGTLVAGKEATPEFSLRPKGESPLRLQFRITYDDPERVGKVEPFADRLYLHGLPSSFTEVSNPYTPGVTLVPGEHQTFVGREDIFEFIRQNLSGVVSKKVLALIGERRTGKTSVLRHLPDRLDDSHYIPVYIDSQGIVPGMSNFLLSLATYIADGLEDAGIPIPRLTPAELGDSPQHVFERSFLPTVREHIREHTLLLTIDEFEHLGLLVKSGGLPRTVFPYLRHLIQHEEQLAFILAGTHKIEAAIGDYGSALFNLAVYKKIGFLEREEAARLVTDPVQPCGMVYDDLAVDEVLCLTGCHPYFTQLLCHILVNRCNEERRSYVTVQNVRDAVKELMEAGSAHLKSLWYKSDQEASLVLAAMAELQTQSDRVTAAAIADRLWVYRMPLDPGQIVEAMERLFARDIVRETPGTVMVYDFTAQLYGHWLRRYKSLSKVVEVITYESATERTLTDAD